MPKTLVILHGWGSDLSRWRSLVSKLELTFHVVLPQLPEDKVRNTAAFADWLEQKTKSLPPFFLLGHSFGGQVAINFSARYPDRLKKLLLIASAGVRRPSLKSRLFYPLAKLLKRLPQKLKVLAYGLIGETDYIKANPIMKETMKIILKEDQRVNLKKISVPTLLIWGKYDRYTPISDGRLMRSLIPGSRLIVVAGGRHGLPFTHAPLLAEKVLWFIGSN